MYFDSQYAPDSKHDFFFLLAQGVDRVCCPTTSGPSPSPTPIKSHAPVLAFGPSLQAEDTLIPTQAPTPDRAWVRWVGWSILAIVVLLLEFIAVARGYCDSFLPQACRNRIRAMLTACTARVRETHDRTIRTTVINNVHVQTNVATVTSR